MEYMGGSYYNLPKAIFYLLKGDYSFRFRSSASSMILGGEVLGTLMREMLFPTGPVRV